MTQSLMAHWPYAAMSALAMLLFIAVFAGVCWRTFGPGGSRRYAGRDAMPLDDLKPLRPATERKEG